MKKIIEGKNLMIQLLKHKQESSMHVDYFLSFIDYLYKSLYEKNMLNKYEITFDMNTYTIKRVIDYYPNIFNIDTMDFCNTIELVDQEKLEEYIKLYLVDRSIDKIIKNYCHEQEKLQKQKQKVKKLTTI